jgi:L-threonylcarbamoyladenylate synthase
MEPQIRTQIFPISIKTSDHQILENAATLIQEGRLVAFPTETVYGLGADAFNPEAVQSIFIAKDRPSTDPLIVHIESIEALRTVAINIPEMAWKLANRFWPGPLTLILEKHPKIPNAVTSGGNTVAVRVPNHQIALKFISLSGCPIAAPSANRFSKPSPTQAHHVWNDLHGRISMILDSGPTDIGLESTVLDLTQSPPCILRPGGISLEKLKFILPNVNTRTSFLTESKQKQISPGQLFKHYSPNAALLLFNGDDSRNVLAAMVAHMEQILNKQQSVGAMLVEEHLAFFHNLQQKGALIENLGSIEHIDIIAKNLFGCIRNLDSKNVDIILMHMLHDNELGLAINDRLVRASNDILWIDS